MGKAYRELRKRVQFWIAKTKIHPKRVQIQSMTNKWASCSTLGTVSFSAQLLRRRPDFQDQVIVHELLHLKIPNHSKLFKSLLRAYVTDRVQGREFCESVN
jgi:predicted metal-dependent hydrolase